MRAAERLMLRFSGSQALSWPPPAWRHEMYDMIAYESRIFKPMPFTAFTLQPALATTMMTAKRHYLYTQAQQWRAFFIESQPRALVTGWSATPLFSRPHVSTIRGFLSQARRCLLLMRCHGADALTPRPRARPNGMPPPPRQQGQQMDMPLIIHSALASGISPALRICFTPPGRRAAFRGLVAVSLAAFVNVPEYRAASLLSFCGKARAFIHGQQRCLEARLTCHDAMRWR